MPSMNYLEKSKIYFKEYIGTVRWVKTILMPVVIALIISNYLDIQCSYISAKFTSIDETHKTASTLLNLYILYFLIGYSLKYAIGIFNAHFIAVSMRTGYRNFFYEYLTIKYKDFQQIGIGEVQYNIVRRSNALAEFLTTLTMTFISNVFFSILVIHTINSQVPFPIKIRIFGSISIFLFVSLIIQFWRTKLRQKVNNGLQNNFRRLYDSLLNYERIIAYDNIDVECTKYYDSMHDQAYYGIFYWITFELVGLANSIFFIFLNLYLIHKFNTLSSMNTDGLKKFIILLTKLREKVFDLSRDLDDICTNFTNLDQSIIEKCEKEDQNTHLSINSYEHGIFAVNLQMSFDNKIILSNINCVIPKGSKIAVVGKNGCGKSTFVKMLMGFYDYNGSLKLDDYEYSKINRKSLRDLITYVPQSSCLFDSTLLENLILGNPTISSEKVIEFCKLYSMHNLFKKIGYDKSVGERGKNLSGGQRQKVSFMRSVIRNTPILIFDEATSNMDSISELEIIQLIKTNMANKTVIMVIHNIDLLKHFDTVLFFSEGTLSGKADYNTLLLVNQNFKQFCEDTVS